MDICERFKEYRDRNRWIVYFPNAHEGEDPVAYGLYMGMIRAGMGLMILAPDQQERFEPVYRDSLKYHLQTIRHSRLFTSYVPIKTRVYFVETVGVGDDFYACANFCIPGGTLTGGAVDLVPAIQAGCPIILGPAMPDGEWKAGLLAAGGAVAAGDSDEILALAKDWIAHPDSARLAADNARRWLASRS